MTENNKQPGSTSLTIKLPSLEVLTFLVLELYFLGTLIFSVFGLLRGRTNFLFGSLEDVSRFWLSLALGILIYFFARNKQVLLGASIVVAILHFVMPLALQLFASDVETWRFLASLSSGTWVPTGFQTAMFLMDLAFILLLAAVIAAYPTNSYQVARWILMAPVRLARYLGAGWQASKLGEKLLGIGLSVYLINVLLFFGIGLLEGYLYLDGRTLDDKARVIFAVLIAIALVIAAWSRGPLIGVAIIVLVWELVALPLLAILALNFNMISAWQGLQNAPYSAVSPATWSAIGASNLAREGSLFGLALTLFVIAGFKVVRHYANNVSAWFDARHLEVYGKNPTRPSDDEPRDVSVMAVLSLIFAFIFPIIGLILSYSARNSIVYSKGTKTGLELTIAAAIISWFSLIVIGFLVFTWVVAGSLLAIVGPFNWLTELIYQLGIQP